jgi:hypothetical protein
LLLVLPLARGDEPSLSADTGWQRIDEKSGVTLFSRKRVGSDIKEFKGTGIIEAPPGIVEKVIEDVDEYLAFMPFMAEARVISQQGDKVTVYQRLNPPLVSNRDYTVLVEHGAITRPDGTIIYRDTWQTDNDAGPAERPGVVRVKINEGSWLLEPAGPNATQATYQIYTDSGGILPVFIVNHASQLAIPRLFEAVRKQALNPKYRH